MSRDEKINILLVDDRSENLLALEAIIERNEYNLIKAYSGEEALKYLLKYDFAVILLDVQMPGIDGFGTAKIIKAREKTKNIPIIFITANNIDSEHIFTGYSIGAIDYILKPFDPIILKAKVEGFVEIYKMHQKLIRQKEILAEKTLELEIANQELSRTTSELRISEVLANVISETSIDSMIIINEEGIILKVNPAVEQMFLYDELTIIGENITALFSQQDSRKYIENTLEAINHFENIAGNRNLKEVAVTRRDGTVFPAEIQIGKRVVQEKYIVACTIRDITKKKQYQENVTYMAYHDSLTDLPNRRLLNKQFPLKLTHSKQHNQALAIMYLDIDRFKYINDSLGHFIGDKVLQKFANRLKESLREDDFLARVGGDEFTIILTNTNRENSLEMAEDILESFKQPFYIDNYELYITTSIGISIFPYDGEDSTVLMKNADAALYRAKEQGKNKYRVFHSGMNIQSYKTFILQNELRKAIEREELALVYQPRINIELGTVTGAEALLRWNHPNWGTISPAEFIPLAEETGQIIEIGEWVLRTACKQMKEWEEAGLAPIQVAINFSAQQFLQKELMDTIEKIFIEMEVNPKLIEIEITESFLMGNEAHIIKTLNQLRTIGVQISIDDFGIGYSSLNYLRRLPVNILKIDKSFIQDIFNPLSNGQALISTIISLAHNLKMSVIAEGVETEKQLAILRSYNCFEIQGYYFSPPILPKEFETFMLKYEEKLSLRKNKKISYLDHNPSNSSKIISKGHNEHLAVDKNKDILQAALNRTKELYSISSREMDVFHLIVNGLSNKEISDQLFISEHTVKNHITKIFQKLTVNDRLQAMAKIYQACIEEGENLHVQ